MASLLRTLDYIREQVQVARHVTENFIEIITPFERAGSRRITEVADRLYEEGYTDIALGLRKIAEYLSRPTY